MKLVTAAEVQAMLGISDDPDGRLAGLIETASSLIEEHLNRRLLRQQYIQLCSGGGHELLLYAYPVESAASVLSDGREINGWMVDQEHGALLRKSGWPSTTSGYAVTYTGGYLPEELPAPIKQACILLVAALNTAYAHNGQQVASEGIGDYRVSFARPASNLPGIDTLSPAAACLLQSYRHRTF